MPWPQSLPQANIVRLNPPVSQCAVWNSSLRLPARLCPFCRWWQTLPAELQSYLRARLLQMWRASPADALSLIYGLGWLGVRQPQHAIQVLREWERAAQTETLQ